MNISILTVFEKLYQPFLQTSLVQRAQKKAIVQIDVQSFFSFIAPKKRIDAPTFGPGAGMLIRPTVVKKAVEKKEAKFGKAFKIFFSPQGEKLNQRSLETIVQKFREYGHLMLLPARYEGMDVRVEDEYADMVVSIGDFVLMGGDMPAMMLIEGLLRLIPGVVGKEESVRYESFTGPFVDYPSYTEPVEWKGRKVPDIVRSGNHAAIDRWRSAQAAKKTVLEHFSWMRSQPISEEQKDLAKQFIPPHYVALMHTDVLVAKNQPGVTSVTSLDLHDIARSSRTYGIKNFFVVTPLIDQQKIVRRLLDFWQTGIGIEYNRNRYEAVKLVRLISSLDEVIRTIEKKEGKKPLLVATSARPTEEHGRHITFYDQSQVWVHDRPVLVVLGTGKGLTEPLIKYCDYLLGSVHGFSDFNHLSVRSAAAIILDRWLGINEKIV